MELFPQMLTMIDTARLRTDLLALVLLAAAFFAALSIASYDPADPPFAVAYPAAQDVGNWCGEAGSRFAAGLLSFLGLGGLWLLAGVVIFDFQLLCATRLQDPLTRTLGWSISTIAFSSACHLLAPSMTWHFSVYGSGGYVGAVLTGFLTREFSFAGTLIIVLTSLLAGMLMSMDRLIWSMIMMSVTAPWRIVSIMFESISSDLSVESSEIVETVMIEPARRIATPVVKAIIDAEIVESDEPIVPVKKVMASEEELLGQCSDVISAKELKAELNRRLVSPVSPGSTTDAEVDELEIDEFVDPIVEAVLNDAAEEPLLVAPVKDSRVKKDSVKQESAKEENGKPHFKVNPPLAQQTLKKAALTPSGSTFATSKPNTGKPYLLPSLQLLENAEDFPYEMLAEKAQQVAATIETTFQQFGLNVKVAEIDTGPVVTQYELELEPGLRVSKVTALADDLAIALRVPSVRVVSPIPGKNTVGVEVPNEKQVMVRLRELIEATHEKTAKMRLPIFLGKDVSGRPLSVDLAKMPHLLIAGRTGTGKSVCLNTLILSLLMTRRPDEVKMLMIDPKMVELSPYMRIPHLMHPVITDMKKAEAVLGWAVEKMEERYGLLARFGVRHLDGYNALGKDEILTRLDIDPECEEAEEIPGHMPYIVIIADEMADMMMTSGKDVEAHIIRLAQKSRAVGIHLVLATQKPTVDVITGLIKSNLPARVSFQVASRTDSRVVLDEMGAERLLGCGDMLYLAPGTSNLSRAQGTYVSDEEVNSVIRSLRHYEPEYSPELVRLKAAGDPGKTGIEALKERDEVYMEAIEVVVRERRGSVSLLQRCLGIGYGRAARLVDYMAEDGIVGDYNGSQAREVLYTPEQWEQIKNQDAELAEV